MERIRTPDSRFATSLVRGAALALVVVALAAGPALADKGGGGHATSSGSTATGRAHHDRTDTSGSTLLTPTTTTTTTTSAGSKSHGGGGHKGGGGGGGGSTGGSGTLAMVMVNDWNTDGLPNWADWVSFTISTTATDQPWVNLKCYVNGYLVAEGWNGYFVGSLTGTTFGLYSPQWSGGPAECTAYLTNPQWQVLGSTSFHVNG